jgi:type III secretory pathway lipoprotein EscJ
VASLVVWVKKLEYCLCSLNGFIIASVSVQISTNVSSMTNTQRPVKISIVLHNRSLDHSFVLLLAKEVTISKFSDI